MTAVAVARWAFFLVLVLGTSQTAACAYDPGEPGSPRRQAFDTLKRTEFHCVGRRHIRCHTHLDGKPDSYRSSWRRRR